MGKLQFNENEELDMEIVVIMQKVYVSGKY